MKHVSIHPFKYLRTHLVYEKIWINVRSLLTSPVIILILLIAIAIGGLYTTLAHLDTIAPAATDNAYTNPYPYEMPYVVITPLVGIPSYLII